MAFCFHDKPIPTALDGVIFLSQDICFVCIIFGRGRFFFSHLLSRGWVICIGVFGPASAKTGNIPDGNIGNEEAPLLYKMWEGCNFYTDTRGWATVLIGI